MMRKLAISLAVTLAIATLPGTAGAGNIISQDDLAGSIIFTYDGGGFDSTNVTNVEVKNSVFTSVGPLSAITRPDYFNYGFNLNIDGLSLAQSGLLSTVAITGTDDDLAPARGIPAGAATSWTIDYYDQESFGSAGILDGPRKRVHTVLSGSVVDLQLSTLGDGSLRAFGHLNITDGFYHTVNDTRFEPLPGCGCQVPNPGGFVNDPATKALILAFFSIDVTNVDLTNLEFESIYAFNNLAAGTIVLDSFGNVEQNRLEFQALSSYLAVVPEPGTLAIFGIGLAGLGLMRRRRRAA